MKKFISSILMMLFAITAMAQNDYVATLQHGEDISYYYGSGAFLSAYNAAAEGDVITLSSGSFGGCTVEKGITVRGVGIDAEGQSTNITGQVNVYSPSAESVTTFEGIYFSEVHPYADGTKAPEAGHILFVKNRFSTFSMKNTDATVASTPKLDIINCVFEKTPAFGVEYTNVKVYNSYISGSGRLSTTQSEVSNTAFINCLIYCPTYYSSTYYCNYASFTNCIIRYYSNYYSGETRIPSNATIMNCITDSGNVFANIPNYTSKGNQLLNGLNPLFKSGSFPTSWTKGATFELTDEAAATYLGVDDTQVGMHGSRYPYNTTVSYPIVTTFNTSGKTTNSGDLNIEVQVNNVQ